MKFITPVEKVILTAEENAILEKAKDILWEMYNNAEDGGELSQHLSDIIDNIDLLEDSDGDDFIIEVDPPKKNEIKITIKV